MKSDSSLRRFAHPGQGSHSVSRDILTVLAHYASTPHLFVVSSNGWAALSVATHWLGLSLSRVCEPSEAGVTLHLSAFQGRRNPCEDPPPKDTLNMSSYL